MLYVIDIIFNSYSNLAAKVKQTSFRIPVGPSAQPGLSHVYVTVVTKDFGTTSITTRVFISFYFPQSHEDSSGYLCGLFGLHKVDMVEFLSEFAQV